MPYNTPDAPPIRLVVLACNKPAALTSLLANLRAVGEAGGFVGHNVSLTLSLDVPRGATSAADAVAALAQNFSWAHGPKAVVRQPQHVGILGQWLSVAPASDDDWAVVLEDDLALSPCFYRHLLAQRRAYGGRRDVAGVTLQPLDRHACFVGHGCAEPPTPPFLSPIPGSWGFMPRPAAWRGFVAWQKAHAADDPTKGLPADFQPSAWYRGAAAAGRADSMWTIWHIAYTAAKGQATLVPAPFSAPLVYPHGTQASEHAHARGRPASAAAAARLALLAVPAPAEPPPAKPAPFEGLLTRCEEVEAPAALPTAPRAYGFDRVEVRPWPARVALWL